jgi:hypothetical protein
MSKSSVFVLLATFDPDPGPIPNEIWVTSDQAAAENFLRSWSEDFLYRLPPDDEIVAAFRDAGARVHLYECDLDGGGGDEVVPFERAPDLQLTLTQGANHECQR